jgi:hypothetical protein
LTLKGCRQEGTKPVKRLGIGLLERHNADHTDLSDLSSGKSPKEASYSDFSGKGRKGREGRKEGNIHPADALSSHLGDASKPVGGGNSANEADSGKRKPCADAGYSPVDNFPAGDDAPFPPVDNFPPGASDGARQLWEVLKHVQGSETADRLAQRLVGWNAGGVNIAARELQGHGRASINGAFIGPIHPPTPGADEGRI